MPHELKRKPRAKPTTAVNDGRSAKRAKVGPDTPKTSAQPPKNSSRQNLILADWLTVYAYIDAHPTATQASVVQHFRTLQSGALLFTQSTLSRKLQKRSEGQERLKAVMDTEGSAEAALSAIEPLKHDADARSGLKIRIPLHRPEIPQLQEIEAQLMEMVNTLKSRNRIFDPPTFHEIVDPPEEKEIRQGPLLETDQSDEAIVAIVRQEMAAAKGDSIEVESDDEDDPPESAITRADAMSMCQLLERAVKEYGDADSEVVDLSRHLYRFRAKLRRQEFLSAKQTTLDSHSYVKGKDVIEL